MNESGLLEYSFVVECRAKRLNQRLLYCQWDRDIVLTRVSSTECCDLRWPISRTIIAVHRSRSSSLVYKREPRCRSLMRYVSTIMEMPNLSKFLWLFLYSFVRHSATDLCRISYFSGAIHTRHFFRSNCICQFPFCTLFVAKYRIFIGMIRVSLSSNFVRHIKCLLANCCSKCGNFMDYFNSNSSHWWTG